MQIAMSGLLGESVVFVVSVFSFLSVNSSLCGLQDTTRMSMTIVVLGGFVRVRGRCLGVVKSHSL